MPQLNWKQIGIVAGFTLVCIALGAALYYLFFYTPEELPPDVVTPSEPNSLPIAGPSDVVPPTTLPPVLPTVTEQEITVIEPFPIEEQITEVAGGGLTRVTDIDFNTTPELQLAANGRDLVTYNEFEGTLYQLDENGNKTRLGQREYPNALANSEGTNFVFVLWSSA